MMSIPVAEASITTMRCSTREGKLPAHDINVIGIKLKAPVNSGFIVLCLGTSGIG
jgi:hypothetical protein